MKQQYSSLHNHTHFSLLDGYATPKEYLQKAQEVGLKAFAVTEHGNQYSWCYFDKLKKDFPDIKIIYGVEFYECFDMSVKDKNSKYFHLIVLARNETGRKVINRLITKSNLEGFYYKPRIDLQAFKDLNCGSDVVVSSACLASKLAKEEDFERCIEYIREYKDIFPYFYLEMQSHKHQDQADYNKKILALSQATDTPFIITTDSHAATQSDLYYQARHVQIAHDSETMSEVYEGCYLQTVHEIHTIMDSQIGTEAVNTGLENTNIIADLIEDVSMPFQRPKLPTFPLPKGFDTNYDYLKYLVKKGYSDRGLDMLDDTEQQIYKERLNYELDIIHSMGFDGYFLIVWDFINYAKSQDIMIGPGRGSAAGSLVCYCMHITELNPIKYGLIFERFLNPERISMPDIDTDVSDRGAVIDYLINKFGSNCVCQIINFSYITPIVAVKDIGKILGFSYAETDKLSKRFTYDTFEECLIKNEEFVKANPKYDELFDIAKHLSGRVKTVSCHAGGVGIVDTDINDYMAMKLGGDGEHVIQVDKRIVEEIGIIKFDILGVKTLNMIKEIKNDIKLSDYDININNPNFETNKKPYELLCNAMTNGVFQVESAGMKDLLLRLKPGTLDDLSAVLALYRPDSMGALEDYIKYKHNPSDITYIHSDMIPILKETYGQMIYQEQLLDIVRKFGGRSYGGADLFRKAIGKKDITLVKQESEKLYQEIIDNGYSEEIAKAISDELSTKGGYLFNKSHSYGYAVICFQTAYLKMYHTLYFFKALFNLNKDKNGMLNKYILDAKTFNVTVLPPDINKSDINFTVSNNSVLFGLSAIKGIGDTLANFIINSRSGGFNSISEFITKINPTKLQMVMLIKAGAFPASCKKKLLKKYLKMLYKPLEFRFVKSLPTYKTLTEIGINTENYRISSKKYDYDREKLLEAYNEKRREVFLNTEKNRFQRYKEDAMKYLDNEPFWEFEALQIFISYNPFNKAYEYLPSFEDVPIGEKCTIAGVAAKIQKKKDKHKKQFAFINIYSTFGLIEGILWHDGLKQYEDYVKTGNQLVFLVRKEAEDKVVIEKIKPYNIWLNQLKKKGVYI